MSVHKGKPHITKEPSQAELAEARLNRAYRRIFGTEGNRSPDQELVWADMVHRSCFLRPVNNKAEVETPYDPIAAHLNEGKRIFFLGTLTRVNAVVKLVIPDTKNAEKTGEQND